MTTMKSITFILALLSSTSVSAQQTWSTNPNAWTTFNGSPGTGTCGNHSSTYTGTCVSYVDPVIGNNATCAAVPLGTTPTTAQICSSPGYAQNNLMRNGYPDWLLLARGRQYATGFYDTSGSWNLSGRSANEPMLIAGYGTGADPLFTTNGQDSSVYSTSHTNGQYMAIQGIDTYNDQADPASPTYAGTQQLGDMSATSNVIANIPSTSAIQVGYIAYASGINGLTVTAVTANSVTLSGNPQFTALQRPIQFNRPLTQPAFNLQGLTNWFLMEGCKMRFGSIVIQNSTTSPVSGLDLVLRRNTILDAYGNIGHGANGVFLDDNITSGVASITFDQNVVDHNGYNTAVWGAVGNVFSHNFYLHDNQPPITFTNNVTMEASATGAQVRNGGTVIGNLSIMNPIAYVISPGVQFNATVFDQNVVADGSDMIIGRRTATAATAPGSNVLSMDGILTAGNGSFIGERVRDLSNPGAIPLTAGMQSPTATTVALKTSGGATVNVVGGNNGLGIQAGDLLEIYQVRGEGIGPGVSGSFEPLSGVFPIGFTTFALTSGSLPAWVVPGMNVAVLNQPGAFSGGQTTVQSVSGGSITTTAASLQAVNGNEQSVFVIWTPGNYANFPLQTFGPNNVFAGTASAIPYYAYSPQSLTQNLQGNGNFYSGWGPTSTDIVDLGFPGTNQETPAYISATTAGFPAATIEGYDAAIGGPGTAADFIAEARLQSFAHWNPLYTAPIVTGYVRGRIGAF
jgi:hypothetical protein